MTTPTRGCGLSLLAVSGAFSLVVSTPQVAFAVSVAKYSLSNVAGSPAPATGAGTSGTGGGVYGAPTPTTDGYVYAFDTTSQTYVRIPLSAAGKPDPTATYRYSVSPACAQATPIDGVNCQAASQYCAANGGSGSHEYVWRTETSPVFKDWVLVGDLCTGAVPDPVSPQQIIDNAHEYERDHMPPGVPLVQPGNIAIVNIPVLASVTPLQQQIMDVQLPVPGELVATPSYSWTFDDGTTVSGSGTAYDGTDPRTNPGHYAVAHTYTKAQAQASVALTITWNATFTAAGETITIPALVMPPITTTFTVDEAHAVLVSG